MRVDVMHKSGDMCSWRAPGALVGPFLHEPIVVLGVFSFEVVPGSSFSRSVSKLNRELCGVLVLVVWRGLF